MAASRKARNVTSVVKRQAQRRTAAIDKLAQACRTAVAAPEVQAHADVWLQRQESTVLRAA